MGMTDDEAELTPWGWDGGLVFTSRACSSVVFSEINPQWVVGLIGARLGCFRVCTGGFEGVTKGFFFYYYFSIVL